MNNYIDERLVSYKRPQKSTDIYRKSENGRPLTVKKRNDGILMGILRFVAAVFLLFLSTLGGEEGGRRNESEAVMGKMVKNCIIGAGSVLVLWGLLVVMSNLVNAVTFLPLWSLILIFAATLLCAAGVLKK